MDQYTQAAVAYLRSKRGVRNVATETNTGVSELEIAKWEDQNIPHEIPEDYKDFLRVSNGFRLKWDLLFHGEPVQLGGMCINRLKDVQRVDINISAKDDREPTDKYFTTKRDRMPVAAFTIDKHCKCGNVALVYSKREVGNKEIPEVWFQDLSGKWNFLSKSFIVYFRMMVAHLGLPNWQYRFTEFGMDPISRQWFHLLAPENFTFDLNALNVRSAPKEKGRSATKVTPTPTTSAATSTQSLQKMKSGSKGDMKIGRMNRASLSSVSAAGKDRARRKKQNELLKNAYRVRPKSAFN